MMFCPVISALVLAHVAHAARQLETVQDHSQAQSGQDSRSLFSRRLASGSQQHSSGQDQGGVSEFQQKFGKFGFGKFGKFGKFGVKFGGKYGKIGKRGKIGKAGKIGKRGHFGRPYHGYPHTTPGVGYGTYHPSAPVGGYHQPRCNTPCGARQFGGIPFNYGPPLESHSCAQCKWKPRILTSCGRNTKLVRLGARKLCCRIYSHHPRCVSQHHQPGTGVQPGQPFAYGQATQPGAHGNPMYPGQSSVYGQPTYQGYPGAYDGELPTYPTKPTSHGQQVYPAYPIT
eukprot:TRINITY_DN49621_c0_g1_i1.p1 TRINITY_DN49621_c0_g1~~TRINITY_DN49621_c0_g1_i1.p1  ORF type:complete len:285 (-),score=15.58 TRINITY_DN49621_c0_g1_i1:18-872(-)